MPPFVMPESLDGLSATELSGLREGALAEFTAIRDGAETPEALSPENLDAMEALAGHVEAIDAGLAALAAHGTRATALANRFPAPAPVVAEPVAEPAPVVAAPAVVRPAAAAVVANAPRVVVPAPRSATRIVAAAGQSGMVAGQTFEGGLIDPALRSTIVRRLESVRPGQPAAAFSLVTEYPEELIASAPHDTDVLRRAVDQSRLPGGSIVAAGGWCAPAEQRYDVCTTATFSGGVSLPTVQVPRGSLSYFQNLDYADVASHVSDAAACYTNTELEATGEDLVIKPCFEIPCIDPVTLTLDVCSICLRVGILQQRAFPELVTAYVDQLLVAHAHFLNARDIAQMVALTADTAVMDSTYGAIAPFLDAIDLQATALRRRQGMSDSQEVEMVAPSWLPGVFRSDYQKRQFKNGSSAGSEISGGLAERNIAVQWVRDYGTQDDPFVAAAPGPLSWPDTADVLLYTAGTFVKGETAVIDVGPLYDSQLLSINRQQLLFAETASQVGRFCGTSVTVTVPLCPSGETAGPVDAIGEAECPTY